MSECDFGDRALILPPTPPPSPSAPRSNPRWVRRRPRTACGIRAFRARAEFRGREFRGRARNCSPPRLAHRRRNRQRLRPLPPRGCPQIRRAAIRPLIATWAKKKEPLQERSFRNGSLFLTGAKPVKLLSAGAALVARAARALVAASAATAQHHHGQDNDHHTKNLTHVFTPPALSPLLQMRIHSESRNLPAS